MTSADHLGTLRRSPSSTSACLTNRPQVLLPRHIPSFPSFFLLSFPAGYPNMSAPPTPNEENAPVIAVTGESTPSRTGSRLIASNIHHDLDANDFSWAQKAPLYHKLLYLEAVRIILILLMANNTSRRRHRRRHSRARVPSTSPPPLLCVTTHPGTGSPLCTS